MLEVLKRCILCCVAFFIGMRFCGQLLSRLGLSWRCTYAAVQYTDRLFSKIHLTRRSYQLTAAAAIAVAAKVEEAFDEIPSLSMILMADEVCAYDRTLLPSFQSHG